MMPKPVDRDEGESTPLLGAAEPVTQGTTESPRRSALGLGSDSNFGELPDAPSTPGPQTRPTKSSTNASWGDAVGLPIRDPNDENLLVFRRSVGIHSLQPPSAGYGTLEEGRKSATGIYALVIQHQWRKRVQYLLLLTLIYICHFAQIVLGAVLTVLGPSAQEHKTAITVLGATNTIVAGFLALITRQGAAEKLHTDEVRFRKLQVWIEETDTLLAMGVIGRDRTEVGRLVESAFRKYNKVEENEETNKPDQYERVDGSDGSHLILVAYLIFARLSPSRAVTPYALSV